MGVLAMASGTVQAEHMFGRRQGFQLALTDGKRDVKRDAKRGEPRGYQTPQSIRVIADPSTCLPRLLPDGANGERRPLVMQRANFTLCRTAKAGSTELRAVTFAHNADKQYKTPTEKENNSGTYSSLPKLSGKYSKSRQQLSQTRHIMFARHPVIRVLSGWMHICTRGGQVTAAKGGCVPSKFARFIAEDFKRDYDETCGDKTLDLDGDGMKQHWVPAQHCRCGIPCGVQWEFFKIEDVGVLKVMKTLLPDLKVDEDLDSYRAHKGHYDQLEGDWLALYLTGQTLQSLNDITAVEQKFFGYQPWEE